MELDARAKINLTLDILRRREDGYHDMQMVMQSVTLADRLTVTPARGAEGQAASDLRFLPTGNKNLAQVAAAAFREAVGLGGEVDVDIQKRVPVCAGLAGGSADAAAVLRAMNRLSGAGRRSRTYQRRAPVSRVVRSTNRVMPLSSRKKSSAGGSSHRGAAWARRSTVGWVRWSRRRERTPQIREKSRHTRPFRFRGRWAESQNPTPAAF